MTRASDSDDGTNRLSKSHYAHNLTHRLAKLTEEIPVGLIKIWSQEDASTRFDFTGTRGVRYEGVDSDQGIVVRDSNGEMYHSTVTQDALAGKQVLQTCFGEESRFVRGHSRGAVNYKHYVAKSGYYQIVTKKEEEQTIGKIILPNEQTLEFVGDENYIEIEDHSPGK